MLNMSQHWLGVKIAKTGLTTCSGGVSRISRFQEVTQLVTRSDSNKKLV